MVFYDYRFTRTVFPSLAHASTQQASEYLKAKWNLNGVNNRYFYIVFFFLLFFIFFPSQEMREQVLSLNYGFGQTQAFIQMNTEKQSCYVLQTNVRKDKSKEGKNSLESMYKI